jgi:antitoxin CptB
VSGKTGAFLPAPVGLYDGPEDARLAARRPPVKRRAPATNAEIAMTDDVEIRRRRAVFRAMHRGNKEMDWLIGRFAHMRLAAMSLEALTAFERLLLIPDPNLYDMIMHPEVAPGGEHAGLIAELRAFHGLSDG